jgi:hypothetical protein
MRCAESTAGERSAPFQPGLDVAVQVGQRIPTTLTRWNPCWRPQAASYR